MYALADLGDVWVARIEADGRVCEARLGYFAAKLGGQF